MAYLVAFCFFVLVEIVYPLQSVSMCTPSASSCFLVEARFHQELISFLMRTMRSTEREEAEVMGGLVACSQLVGLKYHVYPCITCIPKRSYITVLRIHYVTMVIRKG